MVETNQLVYCPPVIETPVKSFIVLAMLKSEILCYNTNCERNKLACLKTSSMDTPAYFATPVNYMRKCFILARLRLYIDLYPETCTIKIV